MKKKRVVKAEVKKNFHCTICNKSGFSTSYKYNAHLFLHKAIPPRHKCKYCTKEYYRSDEYSRHLAAHEKTQKIHVCDHCDRAFVDKRNLVLHLNIHDDLPNFSKLRYKCEACGVSYCEERLLKYHIRKEHLNLDNAEPTHFQKNLNETWVENVIDSKTCVQITKVNANTLAIKKCENKTNKELKYHVEKNQFQQYMASAFAAKENHYSKAICDYCNKEMLKKSITTHIRERHLKLRRFYCEECHKSFKRHYQLCLHNCEQVGRRRRKTKNQP